MRRSKTRLRRKRRLIALTGLACLTASLTLLSGVLKDERGDLMRRPDGTRVPDTLDSKRPKTAAGSPEAEGRLGALIADPALAQYLADNILTDLDSYFDNDSDLLANLDYFFALDKKASTHTGSLTPRQSLPSRNGHRSRSRGNARVGVGASGVGNFGGIAGGLGAPVNAQTGQSLFAGLASLSVAEPDLAIKTLSDNSRGNRSGYSKRAAFYSDPCLQPGTVVSPCFTGRSRIPASSETLLNGLAGAPASAQPKPKGIQLLGAITPKGPSKTPDKPTGDGPRNGVTGGQENAATPVPLPGSAYLLGVGLLLLLRGRVDNQQSLPSPIGGYPGSGRR